MSSPGIIIYKEWKSLFDVLPDKKRLIVFDMILAYDGPAYDPKTRDPQIKPIFAFILQRLRANDAKYEDIRKKRQESAKARWNDFKRPRTSLLRGN